MHLPSLFRTIGFPCTKLPVLLHFLASSGASESGECRDVKEKLLRLSDNFSGLLAPPALTPDPVSSSEGSCGIQLGFVQSLYLLRFLWRPLVAWSLNKVCGVWDLWLSSGGGTWVRQIKGRVGSPDGETPSSSMVCRLLTELPVASEELLWDVCRKKQQESQESEANLDLDMRRLSDSDLQLQILYLQLHRKLATTDWWGFPKLKKSRVHKSIWKSGLHKCAAQY